MSTAVTDIPRSSAEGLYGAYTAKMATPAPGGVCLAYLHDGRAVAPAFMESVLAAVAAGGVQNILPVGIGSDPAGIVAGRNYAVSTYLKTRPEAWFLWVDSDMTFDASMPARLLAAAHPVERPIVGALAFGMKTTPDGGRVPYPTLFDVDSTGYRIMWDFPKNQLVEVAATGSACILIHRSVFERIASNWYDIGQAPNLLEDGTPDKLGEDMSFIQRARGSGFRAYVHTGIKTGHIKQVTLSEANYVVPPWAADLKAMLPPSLLGAQ